MATQPLVYRVRDSVQKPSAIGVIVASSKESANAFVQGKYGSSAYAEEVDWALALSSGLVCEVLLTKIVTVPGGDKLRVIK